ncbi:MAG TPA: SRPBCC family protein [Pyrinomonadaceae bacterium]
MSGNLKITTPTDREIIINREFNEPCNLVWDAMSKPELIKQWLYGPPGWTMTLCEDNLQVGGTFRWGWAGPDGVEMAMHGVYQEVTPPQRMVRTEIFDFGCDAQAGEQLATIELTEANDQTILTLTVLYPSKEARDGAVASGMDKGVEAGYDRLEEMLTAKVSQ